MIKRILSSVLAVTIVLTLFSTYITASAEDYNTVKTESVNSDSVVLKTERELNYKDYISQHSDKLQATNTYYADITEGSPVISYENGQTSVEINIEESGLYNLEVEYTPIKGALSAVERKFFINGNQPFKELANIRFERSFKDASEIVVDSQGNDMLPDQVEVFSVMHKRISDISGYYNEPYMFYLEKGVNILTFDGIQGDFSISSITACPPKKLIPYSELEEIYKEKGYKKAEKTLPIINAENATLKATYTLVPTTDRSSPATIPYSPSKNKLNTIGGEGWNHPGMWIEWEIEVEESALYQLDFRYKQNFAKGVLIKRKLYIDGEIPFAEASVLNFEYGRSWSFCDNDYLYYLEKGKHTIRLEAVLGDMGDVLRESEDFQYTLNALYREIIMVTGTSPDKYRDYKIERRIENFRERLIVLSERARDIINRTEEIFGSSNSISVSLEAFTIQLEEIAEEPEKVTTMLGDFKNNIISMGETISSMRETPLELDYLLVKAPDEELPNAEGGFIAKAKHEIIAFFLSFVEDYSSFGSFGKNGGVTIDVWVASGREQANVLKRIIDSGFSSKNINVNLKLVQGALLQATIAGKGPDVALNMGQGDPVNYALRNSLYDLSKFEGFTEVRQRFSEGAVSPFIFNGGVYALPETESFYMMFYRKDVLESLNISPPQTWDEFYEILPVLSRNNMEFGLPSTMDTFAMFLYQNGGRFYHEDNKASALGSKTSLQTFTKWTNLYTSYGLPVSFDFNNRFRTGEMPIAIVDYTSFNTLSVFAPELNGYWDFCEIPGVYKPETGKIDRTTVCNVTGCVIFASAKNKDACWEFVKWWLSEDVQVSYGSKIESILGASSRYATANKNARQNIGWTGETLNKINKQSEWVVGIPQIAGGYFTSRHVTNAFNSVINNNAVPNDTLNSYVQIINREIILKRKELGLD